MFWKNGAGSAEFGDVTQRFRQCPRLPGMSFVEIEFFPRVMAMVLAEDDPDRWRQMRPDECEIAESALARMAAGAAAPFL